jgi:DNA-binding transcriptional ArsR family regulator
MDGEGKDAPTPQAVGRIFLLLAITGRLRELSPSESQIMQALCIFSELERDGAEPAVELSHREIRDITGLARSAVRFGLPRLEEMGLITQRRRGDGRETCAYTIHYPVIDRLLPNERLVRLVSSSVDQDPGVLKSAPLDQSDRLSGALLDPPGVLKSAPLEHARGTPLLAVDDLKPELSA